MAHLIFSTTLLRPESNISFLFKNHPKNLALVPKFEAVRCSSQNALSRPTSSTTCVLCDFFPARLPLPYLS